MDKLNNNYLIDRLKDGKELNITLLSHNAYWYELEKLNRHFDNCSVQAFGDGTSYIKLADIERLLQLENSDLIVWYSSRPYSEREMLELKNIAFEISNNKNKRVSIGYSFSVPQEQRIDKNVSEKINIISFYNSSIFEEEINPPLNLNAYNLANITLVEIEKKLFDETMTDEPKSRTSR